MIRINVEREVDLSAETIWEEMRHFDRVLRWVPGGDKSTISVKGNGVGAIRDINLITQGYVQHQLIAFDNEERMFSYKLTAGKPVGMEDYTVVASVTPIDKNNCKIQWAGEMKSDSRVDENKVGVALEAALGNMVTGTIALLKGEKPVFSEQPLEDWQKHNS
tara:strand:- start:1435 stop:1920 length:486 start_codon:yes stop_codon:yes gene_type:complete